MPGYILTYTYKKASHVDHSKPAKLPPQKIGQEIGVSADIARTSRNVTALTRTRADLRQPNQRTLQIVMTALKAQINQGHLL